MSQGNTTVSGFAALLKEYYTEDVVGDATYDKNPLYAMLPKNESVAGAHYVFPLIYGQGQGRSSTFSTAQTIALTSGTNSVKFQVPLLSNWGDASIGSELILSSSGSDGAFLKAGTQVIDGALKNMAVDLEIALFSDGSGYRATIATMSGKTITLTSPKDALKFEVGMAVVPFSTYTNAVLSGPCTGQSTNPAGATVTSSSGLQYLQVAKVDRINGTLTMSATLNSATGGFTDITNGYFLACLGDVANATNSGGTSSTAKILGVPSWIPYGGPPSTGDSFTDSGIDRSMDPVRLAGLWFNGTAYSTEETLIKATALVSEQGGKITHFFMSYPKFAALASSLSSKVQITDLRATPAVGFESIEIMGTDGPVKIIPARACPSTSIFGLNLSTWELISNKKAIFLWDLDARTVLRQGNDSGIEARFMSYSNLVCHEPHQNINILVNAA